MTVGVACLDPVATRRLPYSGNEKASVTSMLRLRKNVVQNEEGEKQQSDHSEPICPAFMLNAMRSEAF